MADEKEGSSISAPKLDVIERRSLAVRQPQATTARAEPPFEQAPHPIVITPALLEDCVHVSVAMGERLDAVMLDELGQEPVTRKLLGLLRRMEIASIRVEPMATQFIEVDSVESRFCPIHDVSHARRHKHFEKPLLNFPNSLSLLVLHSVA
jgi:hypothetical protein